MYHFKNNLFRSKKPAGAFTFIEVVAAAALLTILLSSVLIVMDNFVDAVIDMRLRQQAFELARSNMETLLSKSTLSNMAEYDTSETNPDLYWETIVEPFYEPITDRMWIRAICSAGFTDTKGQEEEIELEHWITNLTTAQIKQIMDQQQVEAEYLELIRDGGLTDIQKTTIAYLEQADLDIQKYKDFIEKQRRQKLEYLDKNGTDGYDDFLEKLQEEEDEFLEDLGMDFDDYNKFAENYVPPETESQPGTYGPDTTPGPEPDNRQPGKSEQPWWKILPEEYWYLFDD